MIWKNISTKRLWLIQNYPGYIGVLEKITNHCIVLSDVDAHDNMDTSTSKGLYVLESKSTGIKSNRQYVHVNLDHVISFSLLEDVKEF